MWQRTSNWITLLIYPFWITSMILNLERNNMKQKIQSYVFALRFNFDWRWVKLGLLHTGWETKKYHRSKRCHIKEYVNHIFMMVLNRVVHLRSAVFFTSAIFHASFVQAFLLIFFHLEGCSWNCRFLSKYNYTIAYRYEWFAQTFI